MTPRLTPRALREAKRIKTWWRKNRPAAPDLFDDELEEMIECLLSTPTLGIAYKAERLDVPVFRVLLSRTENHLYYAVQADEIVVLSMWGARKERGPTL
jgi:plasmid stabilization system protein ParE